MTGFTICNVNILVLFCFASVAQSSMQAGCTESVAVVTATYKNNLTTPYLSQPHPGYEFAAGTSVVQFSARRCGQVVNPSRPVDIKLTLPVAPSAAHNAVCLRLPKVGQEWGTTDVALVADKTTELDTFCGTFFGNGFYAVGWSTAAPTPVPSASPSPATTVAPTVQPTSAPTAAPPTPTPFTPSPPTPAPQVTTTTTWTSNTVTDDVSGITIKAFGELRASLAENRALFVRDPEARAAVEKTIAEEVGGGVTAAMVTVGMKEAVVSATDVDITFVIEIKTGASVSLTPELAREKLANANLGSLMNKLQTNLEAGGAAGQYAVGPDQGNTQPTITGVTIVVPDDGGSTGDETDSFAEGQVAFAVGHALAVVSFLMAMPQ